MKDLFYIYADNLLLDTIKDILFGYEIRTVDLSKLNEHNFINNNVVLLIKDEPLGKINKSFFLKNNFIDFSNKKEGLKNFISDNTKVLQGHVSAKKFYDEIKNFFVSKPYLFKNTQVLNDVVTNTNSGLSFILTPIEKEILMVLFNKKQITRTYLLENVLQKRKDIETKTIESHLTRIRKKLSKIKSEIVISSKNENIFLDF